MNRLSMYVVPEPHQPAAQCDATASTFDRGLMLDLYERFDQLILAAVTNTDLPGSFLAALTANESGGKLNASFFEPKVYAHLRAVATGNSAVYGSIASATLIAAFEQNFGTKDGRFEAWLTGLQSESEAVHIITRLEDADLRALSTSWGLTQIMGYQVIGRKVMIGELLDPEVHYELATQIVHDFAQRFGLRPGRDWEPLFRCWNTGRPEGKTFDPEYVSKAQQRMTLYRSISQEAVMREPRSSVQRSAPDRSAALPAGKIQ
ncbi:MAG: hypothetical protein ACRD10_07920 [Terriglobia bacterium]